MPQLSRSLPVGLLLVLTSVARADTLTLPCAADNTLYESAAGNLSNGKGSHLFAGVTAAGALRRALLRFDAAAAIPAGATITSVELHLHMSKATILTPQDVSLHRALQPWGEGASDAGGEEGEGDFAEPGDATWQHGFHPDTFWFADGGDFGALASATTAVGGVGPYALVRARARRRRAALARSSPGRPRLGARGHRGRRPELEALRLARERGRRRAAVPRR